MPEILKWDQTGKKQYETGTKKGVLYPVENAAYPKGYAWNGLTGVTESPSGAEPTDLYADDTKYLTMRSAEEFGGTIEAYMYPDEFGQCDGSADPVAGVTIGQQSRKSFGLSYVTTLGNDTEMNDYGYKIHLVYGCSVSPSERAYQTINDSPEAITFSWEFKSTPVGITRKKEDGTDYKPVSIITLNSTKLSKAAIEAIEKVLYGSTEADARLPLPDEVFTIIENADKASEEDAAG